VGLTRLTRLVAGVVVLGVLAQVAALLAVGGSAPTGPLDRTGGLAWAHGWPLLVCCFVLTVAGDAVSVRVRRGEETEELTLFEAACVVDVLVLPGSWALVMPLVATVLVSTARRRGFVKVAFNGGNLAVGVAILVTCTHLLGGPDGGLTSRGVAAITLGMLGLCAVNLVALSRVLQVVADEEPWQVVRDGAGLSTIIAVSTVALGGTFVTLADVAPGLLPFSLMPAGALMFAFQAHAQESEERERSGRLLALSQMLAGRLDGDVLNVFLDLGRQAFGADVALAVLDPAAAPGGALPMTVTDDRGRPQERRTSSLFEADLLWRTEVATTLSQDLPDGWERALVAPLEADGRRLGVVVLATRDRRKSLSTSDLTLLTPLASALAVALRASAHLQRLEEETSKLQAVVDQSSDGILVLDGEGSVQLWSPALETLTGRSEVAALGRPLASLIATATADGTPRDPFRIGGDQLTPERPQATVELVLTRDDGEQRVIRCAHAAAFDEGLLVRDVVILHDITRERQVERLKADFIATVSHELRTPVTPIKGYADLLLRRGHTMTDEKRNECLAVISDRADHLTRLVEDLLLASRISATAGTAGNVAMGREDLGALVHRACGDFGDQNARVRVDVPTAPVLAACDPVRVIQVLTNLVSNALKYSPAGSPVVVRLRKRRGKVVVEVQDSGRGIPADQVEQVFEKFHRVEDPMLMTTGGTGLGLYIARELAQAMGGTLTCTSTLGVGSVFAFVLSVAVPLPPAAAPAAELADLPRPRRAPPLVTAPPRPEPADGVISP
jgi:PAS domain S-box-containing protein